MTTPADIREAGTTMNTTTCTCGTPNRATHYLCVVVANDETTDYVDLYLCDEHTPNVTEGLNDAQRNPYGFSEDAERVHELLGFDNADEWTVIEYRLQWLRWERGIHPIDQAAAERILAGLPDAD